eukprot:CAMPEP_0169429256 /NCGR_PEP_ID=MMETSP1042-20121227/1771_1 /TAXON_ID=464988 /ORGANISM="Hemiselmis andersenii, Strain CCMP1180" /LENGTH=568 /DNA_ID=CAMNT_0009539497 /DNA_START=63 /DNA_END=1770 /DNA_ORIENTATION=-
MSKMKESLKKRIKDVPGIAIEKLENDLKKLIGRLIGSTFGVFKAVGKKESVCAIAHQFCSVYLTKRKGTKNQSQSRIKFVEKIRKLEADASTLSINEQVLTAEQRQQKMGKKVMENLVTAQLFFDLEKAYEPDNSLQIACKSKKRLFAVPQGIKPKGLTLQTAMDSTMGTGNKREATVQQLKQMGLKLHDVGDGNMTCLAALTHQLFGANEAWTNQLCIVVANVILKLYTINPPERRAEFKRIFDMEPETYVDSLYHHSAERLEICLFLVVFATHQYVGKFKVLLHDLCAGECYLINDKMQSPPDACCCHIALYEVRPDGSRIYKSVVNTQLEEKAGGLSLRRRSRSQTPVGAEGVMTPKIRSPRGPGTPVRILDSGFRGTKVLLSLDTNVFLEGDGRLYTDIYLYLHSKRESDAFRGIVRIFVPFAVWGEELDRCKGIRGRDHAGSQKRANAENAVKWIHRMTGKRIDADKKVELQDEESDRPYKQRCVGYQGKEDMRQVGFASDCEPADSVIIVTSDKNMQTHCRKKKVLWLNPKDVIRVLEKCVHGKKSGKVLHEELLRKAEDNK